MKIRNESKGITTDIEINRIIKDYHKQLYINKLNKPDKVDRFRNTQNTNTDSIRTRNY